MLNGGPAPLSTKGAQPPIFGPCLLWPNGWMEQDTIWYGVRFRPRPHTLRYGKPAPSQRRGPRATQFFARVNSGQTVGLIRMPSPHYNRWGPSPPKRGNTPNFRPISVGQMAGWIKMSLGTEVGLSPGHIVLDGDLALPPQKEGTADPTFQPMSIVAKRLDGSRCHLARS